jgi:CCR4-NOT transcription complex subunit 3
VQQLPVLSPLPQQVQQHPPVPVSNAPPPPLQQQPQPQQQQPQFPPGVKVPHGVAEAASTASGTIVQPQQHQQNQSQASSQIIGSQRVPSETASQPVSVPRSTASSAFPGSLSDLVMSFENVKQKGAGDINNFFVLARVLTMGCSGASDE